MWGSFLARLLLYSRDFVGDAESLLWCPRTSAVLVAPVGDFVFLPEDQSSDQVPSHLQFTLTYNIYYNSEKNAGQYLGRVHA
jgi:hypothetical protein